MIKNKLFKTSEKKCKLLKLGKGLNKNTRKENL